MGLLNKRTQPVSGSFVFNAAQIAALIAAIQGGGAGILAVAGDVHEPAADTAAIVTYSGTAGVSHVISGIAFGYDIDPIGGLLTVTANAVVVFTIPVTKSGAGFIPFTPPKKSGVAHALVVTLAAGGAGCTGKVSVLGHWTE
jgi:hypothetical protein